MRDDPFPFRVDTSRQDAQLEWLLRDPEGYFQAGREWARQTVEREMRERDEQRRATVKVIRRRVDWVGVYLFLVGIVSGVMAYWAITSHGADPLFLVPAVVAATTGAAHLTKKEAHEDR